MAEPDKRPVTMEELLVSSLAQTDALAKLMIEKVLGTRWHSGLEVLNFIVVFSRRRIENPVWIGKSA